MDWIALAIIVPQIVVGFGLIRVVWRLNSSVAALTAQMELWCRRTEDHEDRIRKLENP